ncbi:unnamed protein product [Urochloa decumbens]|uniref:Dof zinc finger protein n=1 Tax=Urochloa decumbens TaxID=240449 RepID=A0ABC9DWW0_9POAL
MEQREAAAAEVRCPRCGSANTKFCYYNNYNLVQPRHLCKACRRYWTKGGHLRNVPVGGGCRKPKPSKSKSSAGVGAVDGAAHPDGKAPHSGRAAGAPASSAFSVVTEPSGAATSSSVAAAGSGAAGNARAPPPASMFAGQAAVFASLFAPPKQAEEHAACLLGAEQQHPASFAGRSDGALAAGWPTTAASGGGMLELAGGIAGDASLPVPAYWNAGSWTDPDTTVYLP